MTDFDTTNDTNEYITAALGELDSLIAERRHQRQADEGAPVAHEHSDYLRPAPELSATDPCDVIADRLRFEQMLTNLVENAAKYAVGSPVELYAWERPSKAVIAVVDHGPGIPEEERDRVFERFTQIDQSDTRSKGGTGLGLSIVKSLAEVMRGAVRVEATEGGGATFVVELPLAPSMQRAERR